MKKIYRYLCAAAGHVSFLQEHMHTAVIEYRKILQERSCGSM